jgi:hypothetical protein
MNIKPKQLQTPVGVNMFFMHIVPNPSKFYNSILSLNQQDILLDKYDISLKKKFFIPVHGSSISLVSTASSLYSSAEEKQAHEIRKLRRELTEAQEKVQTLTSQLSTNVSLFVIHLPLCKFFN